MNEWMNEWMNEGSPLYTVYSYIFYLSPTYIKL